MRCSYCASLNIQKLINLAKVEFCGSWLPRSAYYQHHGSIHALEQSAGLGCDLCGLIVRAFAEAHLETQFYFADDDETLLDAIRAWTKTSTIRISIQADHVYTAATLEDVKVFDLLQISVGEETDLETEDDSGVGLPTVCLLLTRPRGLCSSMTDTRISSANGIFQCRRLFIETREF